MIESAKTMIVGAHADDMELWCGGLVDAIVSAGGEVLSVVVALEERDSRLADGRLVGEARREEAVKASRVLRIREPVFLYHYIREIPGSTAAKRIDRLVQDWKPDQVLTHFPIDPHPDHSIVGALVNHVFQFSQHRFRLFYFKTSESYSFAPAIVLDLPSEAKWLALKCHESQGFAAVSKESVSSVEEFIEVKRWQVLEREQASAHTT